MRALAMAFVCAAWVAGCGSPPRQGVEMVPISTDPDAATSASVTDAGEAKGATAPSSAGIPATPETAGGTQDKTGECSGARFDNLYLTLTNNACKVDPKNEPSQDVRNDIEVRINPSTLQIVPGGHVDLLLLIKNKSAHVITLYFLLDPVPRFGVDAIDKRGKPAGVPAGKPPKQPDRASKTYARIFLAAGGLAKMKVGWTASNMRWAPELLKGGPVPDLGFPKVPTKPLPNGRYTVRVLTPLTLITDPERDVLQPKIGIEVGE